MGSRYRARRGLSGLAALVLLTSACGLGSSDEQADDAQPTAPASETAQAAATLASVHRDLPLPPSNAASQLTVVVTHAGGVRDPGLDAAVAALRQRPDLDVVVVAPDQGDTTASTTMSGDPARTIPGDVVDAVRAALDTPDAADLVVIGIDAAGGSAGHRASEAARLAADHGVPAIQVSAEAADGIDYAAATMQLLEVLDFDLAAILETSPRALRLSVPSCREGMLRGRVDVGPTSDDDPPDLVSNCLAEEPDPSPDEDEAFAAGYATLAELR